MLIKILQIIGPIFLLYSITMSIFINFNTGTVISYIISLILILYGYFFDIIAKNKVINTLILLCGSIFFCIVTFIFIYGNHNNVTYNEDGIIVLGASVKGDTISTTLKHRLDATIKYFDKNPNVIIVVSGGQGKSENISEALAMENYLIENGIPSDQILKEDKSTTTYENFAFSKKILDDYFKKPYTTAFITNDFHVFRASCIARSLNLTSTHYKAKTSASIAPIFYFREVPALIKFMFFKN